MQSNKRIRKFNKLDRAYELLISLKAIIKEYESHKIITKNDLTMAITYLNVCKNYCRLAINSINKNE